MANVLHKLTVGQATVGVLLPDRYDAIDDACGVSKVGQNETVDLTVEIDDLKKAGAAASMNIRVDYSGNVKTNKILVAIDKVPAAGGALVGKTYNGGEIKSASLPTRRRLK